MQALRKFPGPYLGRVLRPGDEFTAASKRDAEVFRKIGQAAPIEHAPSQYATRALTAAKPSSDLDAMDIDALRALAARMGLRVHHKAGVYKVREAIRAAQA